MKKEDKAGYTVTEQVVGTGITSYTRTTWTCSTPKNLAAMQEAFETHIKQNGGYVEKTRDFLAWLDHFESKLGRICEKVNIPARTDAMVIFDQRNRGSWRYADPDEVDLNEHCVQGVIQYLTDETATGWQWGCQSFRWYIGKTLALVDTYRRYLRNGSQDCLSGTAYELGILNRERELKFKFDDIARGFKRREESAKRREEKNEAWRDGGNAAKTKVKEDWQAIASRIWDSSLELLQETNSTKIRDEILKNWPAGVKKAPKEGLYRFVISQKKLKNRTFFQK